MKATKLLGSVALTAALAMGAVPAFASQTAPSDWQPGVDQGIGGAGVSNTNKMVNVTTTNNVKTGSGSTAVKASVFDADMQVTVPLQLSVAFASVGSALTCPTDGSYQIINNGSNAVKITHVTATASGFKLVSEAVATSDRSGGAQQYWQDNSARGIAMVLDFGGNNKLDLGKIMDSSDWTVGGKKGCLTSTGASTAGVTEISIPANSPVGINLSGGTTDFTDNPLSVGYQLATVMEIQYTIAKA